MVRTPDVKRTKPFAYVSISIPRMYPTVIQYHFDRNISCVPIDYIAIQTAMDGGVQDESARGFGER